MKTVSETENIIYKASVLKLNYNIKCALYYNLIIIYYYNVF